MLARCIGADPSKHESKQRSYISTCATQLAVIYPFISLFIEAWPLLGYIYQRGLDPFQLAYEKTDEVEVFYVIILVVFWTCLSIALFLFLVAGFANARNITQGVSYLIGKKHSDISPMESPFDLEDEDDVPARQRR